MKALAITYERRILSNIFSMMKYFLSLFVTAFFLNSSAQTIKSSFENRPEYLFHTGKSGNNADKRGFRAGNEIIQVECTGYKKGQLAYTMTYKSFRHGLIIRKSDVTGKEITVNEIERGDRKFGPVEAESVEFDGRILVFYFRYADNDSMKLYVSEVDKSDLQLINTKHLFTYPQKNVSVFKSGKALEKSIVVRKSPDNSKLLVACSGKEDEYFTCVLEKGFKILRQKLSLIKDAEGLNIAATVVDNAGNSITAFAQDQDPFQAFMSNYPKWILMQKSDNSETIMHVRSWGLGMQLFNVRTQCSKKSEKIYLFGDYGGNFAREGIWFTEIDLATFRINSPDTIPYPLEFRKKVYESGFGKRVRDDYEILGADLQIVELDNGDKAFCGSPLSVEISASSTDAAYRAGPVMTIVTGKEKKPAFAMIHRRQDHNEGYQSIFLPYQDKIVAIFNTYEKDITELMGRVTSSRKGKKEFGLVYAVIKNDGTIEKQERNPGSDSKVYFYNTSDCEFISDRKVVIPAGTVDKKKKMFEVAVISVE